ncbi:MAG: LD-carboxypeptidase [Gammaproteobacteria bacterium]|nr:LD-carboxypeptidase [Gammaproteobacteria bacterium]MDH5631175.1 LD-carboxypeptidase [Gammaproteobacteria bacterium]
MYQRRTFLKNMMATALLGSLSPILAASSGSPTIANGKIIKPKRLASGQTIGLIAPSSNAWEDEEIYFAMDILKSFGFKVREGKHLFQRHGYLAGQDKERAWDVNQMFRDKSVDAIYCLRGGYGAPRILPYLDYKMIKANPKVIIGYSDVTALLNAIFTQTGLITFHGPIAKQNFSEYTLENFKKIMFQPAQPLDLAAPPVFEQVEGQAEKDNRLSTITGGKASGRLIGGNLSLMVKLVGTPYEPDYKNNILFLEDVEEAPYRMDGMLTHLKIAGRLNQLSGIVFGKCTDCRAKSGPSLSMEQVLKDRLGDLDIPVLRGVMIGHIEDMSTIPVGAKATLDADAQTLTLNETVVV